MTEDYVDLLSGFITKEGQKRALLLAASATKDKELERLASKTFRTYDIQRTLAHDLELAEESAHSDEEAADLTARVYLEYACSYEAAARVARLQGDYEAERAYQAFSDLDVGHREYFSMQRNGHAPVLKTEADL